MRHVKKLLGVIAIMALVTMAIPAGLRAADEPSVDLARHLQGWWDPVAGPGNELKILVQPKSAADYTFTFDVTIQGRYEGRNISVRGVLTVDREGPAARLTWSNGKSGCDFPVHRAFDGFEGTALRDSCLTAFQVPVRGTWSIHVESGAILLRNTESGETLRFRKRAQEKSDKSEKR